MVRLFIFQSSDCAASTYVQDKVTVLIGDWLVSADTLLALQLQVTATAVQHRPVASRTTSNDMVSLGIADR